MVGRHRRPVADSRDPFAGRVVRDVHWPEHLADVVELDLDRIDRRGRRLGPGGLARLLVDGDDVGERPTGVDADANPSPASTRTRGLSADVYSEDVGLGPVERKNPPSEWAAGSACGRV